MPADAHALTAVKLFQADLGPFLVPVTPPGGTISPASSLTVKVMGKAPGKLTQSGWTGVNLNDPRERCLNHATAKLWGDHGWGANTGFVASKGYIFIDNDQGEEFSLVLQNVLLDAGTEPLRRFVLAPKHKRDAFLVRVLDFTYLPAEVPNFSLVFSKGTMKAEVQILAHGKQAVVTGMHPGTKGPYVWNREITELQDIPILSDQKFYECIRKFIAVLAADGWTVPQAPSMPGNGGVAVIVPTVGASTPLDLLTVRSRLGHVRELLEQAPNRIVPPGETPTAVDIYLDDYGNWVDFTYMIAAAMGPDIMRLPEAEQLFTGWSDGRPQANQSSRGLWRSIISQPIRYQDTALEKKIRELVPPNPPFPDDQPPAPTPRLNALNQEWGYLSKGNGAFVNLCKDRIITSKSFAETYADKAEEITKEMQACGWKPRRKKQLLNAAQLFNEQRNKLVLTDITYQPGAQEFLTGPGSHVYNRWKPPKLQRKTGPFAVKPWLDHVEFITGSDTERDRLVQWLAYVAQCPHEKPNWHFVIISLPGRGKDMLVEPLPTALGEDNCKSVEINSLFSQFNGACEAKLLIVSEAHQPTHRGRAEAANRLKQISARPPPTLTINPKNLPTYEVANLVGLMMFSNDINPVYVEQGDRRYHILNRRELAAQPPKYYEDLQAWFDRGGRDEVAGYLHAYPLTEDHKKAFRGPAPESAAKDALIQQNKEPALAVLEDLIQDARDGTGPFDAGLATEGELVDHIGQRLRRHPPFPSQVRAWLYDMERQKKGVGRVRIDPSRPNECGVVRSKGYGNARLWYLIELAPGNREWASVPHSEVATIRHGRSKVVNLRPSRQGKSFPDDEPI